MRMVAVGMVFLALLATSGCGKPSARRTVQGDVTLHGAPLDRGSITFYPSTGTAAAAGKALIEEGKYYIGAEKGLEPGKYRVQLSSPKLSGGQAEERIPPDYNAQSKQVIEVTAAGPNQFDFAVP